MGIFGQENHNSPSVAFYYTAQYVDCLNGRFPSGRESVGGEKSPGYSKTIGLELALPIHQNLIVNSGFSFFSGTYVYKQNFSNYVSVRPTIFLKSKSTVNDYYLQAPISLQYYFGDLIHRLYLKSGFLLDWHYNRNSKHTVTFLNGDIIDFERFNGNHLDGNVIISGVFGWGGEFKLNRNFKIFLEQETRLGLINKQVEETYQKRIDLGARMGLRFIW